MSNLQKYHVSKNLSPINTFNKTTDLYYSITFSEPLAVGTYTIAANITSDTGVTSARISFRKSDLTQDVATNITIEEGISSVTVTLSAPCSAIFFYGSTTVYDNVPIKYDNIMLNTGSTALPYEPYSADVWHDLTPQQYINDEFVDNANILEKYSGGSWG